MNRWEKIYMAVMAASLIPLAAFIATWFMPDGRPRDLVGMTFLYGFLLWGAAFVVASVAMGILRIMGRVP